MQHKEILSYDKTNKIFKKKNQPNIPKYYWLQFNTVFIVSPSFFLILSLEEISWAFSKIHRQKQDLYLKSVKTSTFNCLCNVKSLRNYMLIAIPSRSDYLGLVNRCSMATNFIRILIKFHSPVLLVLLIILKEINLAPTDFSLEGVIFIIQMNIS